MTLRKAAWSKVIEEAGVQVRIFERAGVIYRDVTIGRVESETGRKRTAHDIKSLKHGDRKRAEKYARDLAREIAGQRLSGVVTSKLELAQLRDMYLRERGPLLSKYRQGEVRKAFRLLTSHLAEDFDVMDLGPHQVDTYTAARKAGTLKPSGAANVAKNAGTGIIAKELGCIHAALNWASTFRRNGRPVISHNPLRGIPIPTERNPSRPVATRDRFDRLHAQSLIVDKTGRFQMMLELAWFTGRRLGSIVALRASDLLLSREHVQRALGAAGMDEHLAEQWPAAVSWVAESDKEGVAWIVPIPERLRASLADYVRARGVVGNALLFPSTQRTQGVPRPLSKETAHGWIKRAEELAGLSPQKRGGWHAMRRAWATARKGMPLQDVMAAGGWRDATALQRAYQHADAETVRAVMELGA